MSKTDRINPITDLDYNTAKQIRNLWDAIRDLNIGETPKVNEDWTAPSLINSWVDYGGSYAVTEYMKDGLGIVWIKGVVKTGTPPSVAFVLPAGYRPAETRVFATVANGPAIAQIEIDSSGNVTIQSGSSTLTSLACAFLAEG